MRTIFWAIVALPFINAQTLRVSTSARCGANYGLTCKGSSFGNCCSKNGYCGSTAAYCGDGCLSGYGDCTSASTPKPATVSTDGTCNGAKGFTCLGSAYGDCCSQHNWCGRTNGHCGVGCNPLYGSCTSSNSARASSTTLRTVTTSVRTLSSSTRTSSSTASSSPLKLSTNARCGNAYNAAPAGMSCLGSKWGDCCSQFSYCGSTSEYCGTGCQPGFGNCNPVSSSSSRVSTTTSFSVSSPSSQSSSSSSVVPSSSSSSATPSSSAASSIASSSSSNSIASTTASISSTASPTSTPVTPPLVCGVQSGSFSDGTYLIINTYLVSQATCKGLCASSQNGCQSYVFYPEIGGCSGYSKPISQLGTAASGTDHVQYDLGCGAVTASSSVSSTSAVSPTPSPTLSSSSSSIVSPSSSTPVATPSAPALICGTAGDFNNPDYFNTLLNIIDPVTDVNVCGAACLQDSTCQSYVFLPADHRCGILSMSLAEGGFYALPGGTQLAYDRGCASQSARQVQSSSSSPVASSSSSSFVASSSSSSSTPSSSTIPSSTSSTPSATPSPPAPAIQCLVKGISSTQAFRLTGSYWSFVACNQECTNAGANCKRFAYADYQYCELYATVISGNVTPYTGTAFNPSVKTFYDKGCSCTGTVCTVPA